MLNEIINFHDIVNLLIGVVLGFATGFYFERRATRHARVHTEALEQQLEDVNRQLEVQLEVVRQQGKEVKQQLRESIYPTGQLGRQDSGLRAPDAQLSIRLKKWLQDRQGADGRVLRASVFGAFPQTTEVVEAALVQLRDQGDVRILDRWIELS